MAFLIPSSLFQQIFYGTYRGHKVQNADLKIMHLIGNNSNNYSCSAVNVIRSHVAAIECIIYDNLMHDNY